MDFLQANEGSEVNISSGSVGEYFIAFSSSEVNISGGTVLSSTARSRSELNITGGTMLVLHAQAGSEANISGGVLTNLRAVPGSDVELIGGEFRLNGADFPGNTITLANDDVFTGTFADGSAFIFNIIGTNIGNNNDLTDVTLTTAPLPIANLNPTVVNTPITCGPPGLRAGQTLTLQAGGSLCDYYKAVDATLNVAGGEFGDSADASGGVVNISGGTVGARFDA